MDHPDPTRKQINDAYLETVFALRALARREDDLAGALWYHLGRAGDLLAAVLDCEVEWQMEERELKATEAAALQGSRQVLRSQRNGSEATHQ